MCVVFPGCKIGGTRVVWLPLCMMLQHQMPGLFYILLKSLFAFLFYPESSQIITYTGSLARHDTCPELHRFARFLFSPQILCFIIKPIVLLCVLFSFSDFCCRVEVYDLFGLLFSSLMKRKLILKDIRFIIYYLLFF